MKVQGTLPSLCPLFLVCFPPTFPATICSAPSLKETRCACVDQQAFQMMRLSLAEERTDFGGRAKQWSVRKN